MGVSLEGVRVPLGKQRVRRIVLRVLRGERVAHALVSVTFVSSRTIRTLNKRHLGRNAETDVIAFGYRQPGKPTTLVGDIYIAPDVARQSARENAVSVTEEVTRLVVHGTLHVAGHDHPENGRERSAMWKRQERLVAHLMPGAGSPKRRAAIS